MSASVRVMTPPPPRETWPVLVPREGTAVRGWILARSGIVGQPMAGATPGRLVIDYEGNRHGAQNIVSWADRVEHAAGRAATQYPTVARAFVEADDLIQVGTFSVADGQIVLDPAQEAVVRAWLGPDIDLAAECVTTGGRAQHRRELLAAQARLPSGHPLHRQLTQQLARLTPVPPPTRRR